MLTKSQNNETSKIGAVQWFLASGLGWMVGNWIAGWLIYSLLSIVPSPVNPQSLIGLLISDTNFALIGGILVGIFVGTFQWVVVKSHVHLSAFWIVTNMFGWSFAYVLGSCELVKT